MRVRVSPGAPPPTTIQPSNLQPPASIMARPINDPEIRALAVRLRIEKRLSLSEIRAHVPAAKGTLSIWLRDHPLTFREQEAARLRSWPSEMRHKHHKHHKHHKPVAAARDVFANKPLRQHVRIMALGRAIAWFSARGYVTSVPTTDAGYDLVVDSDAGLRRVQVKSTTQRDPRGGWVVSIARCLYDPTGRMNAAGKRRRVPYSSAEVDDFFIVTGNGDVYVIPLASTRGLFKRGD